VSVNLFDLTGKVAFITGAASGLGYAMAEAFAEQGAIVVLADIDAESLRRAVGRLTQAGYNARGVELDVRQPARIRELIDAVVAEHGKLDICCANAGISGGPPFSKPEGQIENIDLATWDNVIRVNQTGVFATMQAAAAVMKPNKSGRIIVTCSIAGLVTGSISGYTYSATKAAVVHLVHLAAVELAPYNIMVNGFAPGPFLTNIAGGRLHREPETVAFMANTVPLKRVADPSELKGLALLLASDASSYITGTVTPIDGGTTAM
jgi:NAD(P)-dependent dehydrogenase (short-subunit alcohol dehydrogenase family)